VTTLQLVLVLLAASVLVVTLCRALGLPAVLGYLLVGVMIGPKALNLLPNVADTRYLAEFGVVFLMFSVGLEFSLPRLFAMKRIVFGMGLAQVVVTAAAIGAMAMSTVSASLLSASGSVAPWQCRPPPCCPSCSPTVVSSTRRMGGR
jgi:CPA2 family monovalent cation:H+ antiporter-2